MPEVQFDASSYLIYFSLNYYITNIIGTTLVNNMMELTNNKKYLYPVFNADKTDALVSSNKPAVPKPNLGTVETRQKDNVFFENLLGSVFVSKCSRDHTLSRHTILGNFNTHQTITKINDTLKQEAPD